MHVPFLLALLRMDFVLPCAEGDGERLESTPSCHRNREPDGSAAPSMPTRPFLAELRVAMRTA
jgi:hypothetical protein